MSILHCAVPDFLFKLSARGRDDWSALPVVLTGHDERIWATSPLARDAGITVGMLARQARGRCPDVALHPLDMRASQDAQAAFVATLAHFGLPVETGDWGTAYVDLSGVTVSPRDAQTVCVDYGRSVRATLGETLAPALGCNSGKFTARAAANISQPGRMRVVDHVDEACFLGPLSVGLLPLVSDDVLRLTHLGIRTLGQFARLPVTSVAQRFGKPGKLAHGWANGRDDRPVQANVDAVAEPIEVDFDAPIAQRDLALEAAMRRLQPTLRAMAERFDGCRRVQVAMRFMGGGMRTATEAFAEPISTEAHVRTAIRQCLRTYEWPAELVSLAVTLLDVAELRAQQLLLFDDLALAPKQAKVREAPFNRLTNALRAKYGGAFFQATVANALHGAPERRVRWEAL